MASYTLKLASPCAGGSHGTVNVTGDQSMSFTEVSAEHLRAVLAQIAAMSNKEKLLLVVALHANLNSLTLGQLRTEMGNGTGFSVTL